MAGWRTGTPGKTKPALGRSGAYEGSEAVFDKSIAVCALCHKDLWQFRLINVVRYVSARRKVANAECKLVYAQ